MRIVLSYAATMLLVAAITSVAIIWCDLSHRRTANGPVLVTLWFTHGVHVFYFVVLGIEGVLILLLTATLLAGFSRRR